METYGSRLQLGLKLTGLRLIFFTGAMSKVYCIMALTMGKYTGIGVTSRKI